MSFTETSTPAAPPRVRRFRNSWSVVPLRVFFAAAYAFAGYAKLTYPQFFDDNSPIGFKAAITSAKTDSPISGILGPMQDNASVFGHITAYAELAIAAGLVLGVFTRVAALGGIVLNVLIALSVSWGGIKQYTASSGWYTSVDIAFAVALTVFVLGGSGPLSIDRAAEALRNRRRAREEAAEGPGFGDSDIDASRGRLQAQPVAGYAAPTEYQPSGGYPAPSWGATDNQPTQAWADPNAQTAAQWVGSNPSEPTAQFPADSRGPHNSDDNPLEGDQLEHDSESLWTEPQPGEGNRPHTG